MSNLPSIQLSNLPDSERVVAEALIASLGDDLTALAWQGSWARGEANAESDHDLFVVMRQLDEELLWQLAKAFEGDEHWSAYIKTEEELRQYPAHGRQQFHHGMSLLHGDFVQPPVTEENILADLRYFAVEIGHEARYRLTHKRGPERASAETGRHGRILYYRAKMAILAMKSRELLDGRKYPITRAELRTRTTDPDELSIIDLVDRWPEVKAEYERDFVPMALLLDRFVRRLVSQLPQ
ncbi:MAG: nucleotidyltransferase domain-containing protein [Chloroflexota bacterium]